MHSRKAETCVDWLVDCCEIGCKFFGLAELPDCLSANLAKNRSCTEARGGSFDTIGFAFRMSSKWENGSKKCSDGNKLQISSSIRGIATCCASDKKGVTLGDKLYLKVWTFSFTFVNPSGNGHYGSSLSFWESANTCGSFESWSSSNRIVLRPFYLVDYSKWLTIALSLSTRWLPFQPRKPTYARKSIYRL